MKVPSSCLELSRRCRSVGRSSVTRYLLIVSCCIRRLGCYPYTSSRGDMNMSLMFISCLSSQQGTASRLVKLDPHIIMSQVPQELHLSVRPLRN